MRARSSRGVAVWDGQLVAFEQRSVQRAVVGVEQRRTVDQLLKCRRAGARNKGIDLGFVDTGSERQPGNANAQPGGGTCRAVPQRPLFLGREREHTILRRARLGVVAQHDLLDARCPQRLGPGGAEHREARLAERGVGELSGVVALERRQRLELGLRDDHRLRAQCNTLPRERCRHPAWLVGAERAVTLCARHTCGCAGRSPRRRRCRGRRCARRGSSGCAAGRRHPG